MAENFSMGKSSELSPQLYVLPMMKTASRALISSPVCARSLSFFTLLFSNPTFSSILNGN